MVTSTERWPSAFANDPAGRISVTWASSVVNTAVLLPSFPSFTVKVPGVGSWFVAASSGGGWTHRYAVGGASPSRSGRLANGLRCPDHSAVTA